MTTDRPRPVSGPPHYGDAWGALDIDSTLGEVTTVSLLLPVVFRPMEMSDLVAGNKRKELKE